MKEAPSTLATGYEFRLTEKKDLTQVLKIINDGIAYLKMQSSPQWQNGQGPDEAKILKDIAAEASYVLMLDGEVVGTCTLVTAIDPAYEKIDGKWLTEGKYVAIHRVAMSQQHRGIGLGTTLLQAAINQSKKLGFDNIRIDTYPKNKPMLHLIEKAGFIYCGMIDFGYENGERCAFQLA